MRAPGVTVAVLGAAQSRLEPRRPTQFSTTALPLAAVAMSMLLSASASRHRPRGSVAAQGQGLFRFSRVCTAPSSPTLGCVSQEARRGLPL